MATATKAKRIERARIKARTPPLGFPVPMSKEMREQWSDEEWHWETGRYDDGFWGSVGSMTENSRAKMIRERMPKGMPANVPLLGPVINTTYSQGQLNHAKNYRWAVFKNGQAYRVPTTADGRIDQDEAVYRFLNRKTEGTRESMGTRKRSPMVDLGQRAVKQHDLKDEASFDWWRRINESDIPGIDDPQSKIYEERLEDDSNNPSVASLQVVDRTRASQAVKEKRVKEIKKRLKEHFTLKEQTLFKQKGMIIEIKNLGKDVAGQQWRNNIAVDTRIADGDQYVLDDVVVHETIHWLRENEPKRGEKLGQKALEYVWRRGEASDKDLEEAMTEAETVARLRNYDATKQMPAGYWRWTKPITDAKGFGYGKNKDKDAVPFGYYQHGDRLLFGRNERVKASFDREGTTAHIANPLPGQKARIRATGGKAEGKQALAGADMIGTPSGEIVKVQDYLSGIGVKGELAKRRVASRFAGSTIATMSKFGGPAEAIDQYHRVNDPKKGGYTLHSYSPGANAKASTIASDILDRSPPGTMVAEWNDGKLRKARYQTRYSTRRGTARRFGSRVYSLLKRPLSKREAVAAAGKARSSGQLARRVQDAQGRWWVYRASRGSSSIIDMRKRADADAAAFNRQWGSVADRYALEAAGITAGTAVGVAAGYPIVFAGAGLVGAKLSRTDPVRPTIKKGARFAARGGEALVRSTDRSTILRRNVAKREPGKTQSRPKDAPPRKKSATAKSGGRRTPKSGGTTNDAKRTRGEAQAQAAEQVVPGFMDLFAGIF